MSHARGSRLCGCALRCATPRSEDRGRGAPRLTPTTEITLGRAELAVSACRRDHGRATTDQRVSFTLHTSQCRTLGLSRLGVAVWSTSSPSRLPVGEHEAYCVSKCPSPTLQKSERCALRVSLCGGGLVDQKAPTSPTIAPPCPQRKPAHGPWPCHGRSIGIPELNLLDPQALRRCGRQQLKGTPRCPPLSSLLPAPYPPTPPPQPSPRFRRACASRPSRCPVSCTRAAYRIVRVASVRVTEALICFFAAGTCDTL